MKARNDEVDPTRFLPKHICIAIGFRGTKRNVADGLRMILQEKRQIRESSQFVVPRDFAVTIEPLISRDRRGTH